MSKLVLQMLVLANAVLLAFPPNWCCMVPFPGKSAEEKPQCCRQKEAAPCHDEDTQPEPRQANECCCHIDVTLPSDPDLLVKDLALIGPLTTVVNLESVDASVAHRVGVESILSPPLQILHCVWIC